MTDVHEEPQLGLAHLLGMDMLLQAQVSLFLAAAVGKIQICSQSQQQEVEQTGPDGEIPHGVYLHRELLDVRLGVADDGLHAEAVGARGHMTERELVGARGHGNPRFPVDAVFVGDMVGVVESQCREVQRERVVLVSQFKAVGVDHRTVGNHVAARLLSCPHFLSVHAHTGDVHREFPLDRMEVGGLEPGDALHAAEDQATVFAGIRHTLRELIVLQSVVGEVVDNLTRLRVHLTQSVTGAHPYLFLRSYLDTRNILVGQS